MSAPTRPDDGGQASVEAALALPVVALALLLVLQAGLLLRDQVLLTHSAREGARTASVERKAGAAEQRVRAASGLGGDRLRVDVDGDLTSGGIVRVVVRYASPTTVPLVGSMLGDVELRAEVSMRVE